jgi:hypothetical protein
MSWLLKKCAVLWGLCFALALAQVPADSVWSLEHEKDGIRVFSYEDGQGRLWLRGTVIDSTPMGVVAKVLLDVERYGAWMEELSEAKIVSRSSENDYLLYNYYDVPWPLQDRDIYVRVRIERNAGARSVVARIVREESPARPPREGVVRIPVMDGTLKLVELAPNATYGEFTEQFDVGGSIPGWAKKIVGRQMPRYILQKVRDACRDTIYLHHPMTVF